MIEKQQLSMIMEKLDQINNSSQNLFKDARKPRMNRKKSPVMFVPRNQKVSEKDVLEDQEKKRQEAE